LPWKKKRMKESNVREVTEAGKREGIKSQGRERGKVF